MNINQLKSYIGKHTLQKCQTVAIVYFIVHPEQEADFVIAVYDSYNGHWLSFPNFDEIGYLDKIYVRGYERTIASIIEIN